MIQTGFLKDKGQKIFYKYCPINPKQKSDYIIFLVQGRNETTEMYEHIFPRIQHYLRADIVLYDHLGHGHSTGKRNHINSFDDYLWPLEMIFNKFKSKKNFIVSHSTGALISYFFCLKNHVDGVVLSSPFLKLNKKSLTYFLIEKLSGLFGDLPMVKTTPVLPKKLEGFEGNELTNNRKLYERFFKAGPPTWSWVKEILKYQALVDEKIHLFKTPMLVLLAGEDTIVDNSYTRDILQKVNYPFEIVEFENEKHALFLSIKETQKLVVKNIVNFIGELSPSSLIQYT